MRLLQEPSNNKTVNFAEYQLDKKPAPFQEQAFF